MTISASRTARDAGLPLTPGTASHRVLGSRACSVSIAGLALLPALAATVLRVFPPADDPTARLAAFIPYGLLGYLVALSCLLVVASAGPTPAGARNDHRCRRGADCLSPGVAGAAVCQ